MVVSPLLKLTAASLHETDTAENEQSVLPFVALQGAVL